MNIVFRVDASLEIGIGHVMRCLTLAESLKLKGANVEFICRTHKGNLIEKIQTKGFNVFKLDKAIENNYDGKLSHSHWLGTTQQQDAEECEDILQQIKPDWIIVDHYGIDEDWQKKLQNYCNKLMVIDDLADRKHQCNILLDQTFGRQKLDYENLTPKWCTLLLGSQYALLRPEFAALRKFSVEHRNNSEFKRVLVTMGGVDPDNVTEQVLDELEKCHLPSDTKVTVVMGEIAPHLESVKTKVSVLSYKAEVNVNVENMAEIMANVDVAIGATGATTWERCCLGLPSIQMVMANNQVNIGSELESIRAVVLFNDIRHLCEKIESIQHNYKKMTYIGLSLTNGKGSSMVTKHLYGNGITTNVDLRPVKMQDIDFIYNIQTEEVRRFFKNTKVPSKEEHKVWFENKFKSNDSVLFIICVDESNAGVIRLDGIDVDEVEISIIVSSEYSRRGVGRSALKIIIDSFAQIKIKAVINVKNIPSIKLFEESGFILIDQKEDFYTYEFAG
jgi:UDP-2,4-diacetamido-2,4,6-trideoxy-beta-L-altropyranose hydrolase